MACRPARNRIIENPRFFHAAITISDGSAKRVSLSQPGPVMPIRSRRPLMSPVSVPSSSRQTTAIATMLVTTGR